jgi:hypothetical protein
MRFTAVDVRGEVVDEDELGDRERNSETTHAKMDMRVVRVAGASA